MLLSPIKTRHGNSWRRWPLSALVVTDSTFLHKRKGIWAI